VAEWRSGWQRGLCITRDLPQHCWRGAAWSGESGVPEEVPLRPPSRVIPVFEGRPQLDIQRRSTPDEITRTLPCGQTEGGSPGQSGTSGRVPTSTWPAERVLLRKRQTSPKNIEGQRQSLRQWI